MPVAHVYTVAFEGVEAREVDVQVQMDQGLPAFTVVGLPDKAVAESRERVRSALSAMGLALPPRRVVVNLAPADLPKEGSHYDLPIALGLLAAMGVAPVEDLAGYVVLGELSLDGALAPVAGALPAALAAAEQDRGIICPKACGAEAAWAGDIEVIAPATLLALLNHLKGVQVLAPPKPILVADPPDAPDLADVRGQEVPKRSLEVAAAGGHNLLMVGPPGSGKSMLAARLPGLLPPLNPRETLEVSMIASLAGELREGLSRKRPYRAPHHSASMPALVGGGQKAKPGEISLAHNGVLFLDELPEFHRQALDSLRQPLESGRCLVARANAHVSYPARVQLVAAMNPCRCGYLSDPAQACSRAPRCAGDYQARISGPLLDRIDLHVDVAAVRISDLAAGALGEPSAAVAERVATARAVQSARFERLGAPEEVIANAHADGELLEAIAVRKPDAQSLLADAAETLKLTARGYHRVLRVARTLADLGGCDVIERVHIAEALSYRRPVFTR
jgi:magnesium chelatase family protein